MPCVTLLASFSALACFFAGASLPKMDVRFVLLFFDSEPVFVTGPRVPRTRIPHVQPCERQPTVVSRVGQRDSVLQDKVIAELKEHRNTLPVGVMRASLSCTIEYLTAVRRLFVKVRCLRLVPPINRRCISSPKCSHRDTWMQRSS